MGDKNLFKRNYDNIAILSEVNTKQRVKDDTNPKQYISYFLGYRCNLQCKYCRIDKCSENSKISNGIENLREVLNYQKSTGKPIGKILLSGGEPTMFREEVLEILEEFSNDYDIVLLSNGVKKDVLAEYCKYDIKVIVSYDGHINDRGFDSFESVKMVSNMNRLFGVNIVISNANYPYLYDTIKELSDNFPELLTQVNLESRLGGLNVELVRQSKDFYKFDYNVFKEQIRKVYSEITDLLHLFSSRSYLCENFWEYNSDLVCSHRTGEVDGRGCYETVEDLDNCLDIYENNCEKCDVEICYIKGCPCSAEVVEADKDEHPYCILSRIIQESVNEYRNERFMEKQLEGSKDVELILTDGCNMSCKHCFQAGCHSNRVMTEETVDSVFDKIINKRKDLTYNVNLFGGEPMLPTTLNIRKYFLSKLKERTNKDVIVSIVSNTLVITDEDIEWLKELKKYSKMVLYQVSLDSIPKYNDISRVDKQGKGTALRVLDNLKRVSSVLGFQYMNINSVITNDTLPGLNEWCIFFSNELLHKYIGSISFRVDQTRKDSMTLRERTMLSMALNEVIKSYDKGLIHHTVIKSLFNLKKSTFDENIIKEKEQYSSCGVCNQNIMIEPNGDISPCHTFDLKVSPEYLIGNINTGYVNPKITKIYKLLGSVDDQYNEYGEYCYKCVYKLECVRCKVEQLRKNEDVAKVLPYTCDFVKQRGKMFRDSKLFNRFKPFTDEESKELANDVRELELLLQNSTSEEEKLYIEDTIRSIKRMVDEKTWYM